MLEAQLQTLKAMMNEGLGVFNDMPGAVARRMEQGISRPFFLQAMVLVMVVSFIALLIPELNGISAASDRALGQATSDAPAGWQTVFILAWLQGVATAIVCWKGPELVARIARVAGGSDDLRASAIWIYLGSVATLVVTVAVAANDLVLGLLTGLMPRLAGLLSFAGALAAAVIVIGACAALARRICGVPGPWRAVGMTVGWLGFLFGVGFFTGVPLLAVLFG